MTDLATRAKAIGVPDEYKLVYQSGHTNAFCDGSKHIWTDGGYTECHPMSRIIRSGGCDCAFWQQHGGKIQAATA